MEEKINIAAILKDKKNGIRLYSPIFGECTFCCVREDTNDICVKKHNGVKEYFNSEGLYFALGEVMLFPSKSIRDWEKFSWKRGDILVNSSGFKLFFDRWANDDYTRFFGKVNILEDSFSYETEKYTLASKEETLDTLEIEKTQPEFKIGDILFVKYNNRNIIFILSNINGKFYNHRVRLDSNKVIINYSDSHFQNEGIEFIRYATDEEKQRLFDALAKENKAWDSNKKTIVDFKPKVDLKPFDKVLARSQKTEEWSANIFSHIDKTDEYLDYVCVNGRWEFCIPYEGNESLLGTTKDIEV